MSALELFNTTNIDSLRPGEYDDTPPVTIIAVGTGHEINYKIENGNVMIYQKVAKVKELKEIQNHGSENLQKSKKKVNFTRSVVSLNATFIKSLKTKERQAAQALQDVGFNEVSCLKGKEIVEYFMCPEDSCDETFKGFFHMKIHYFETHNNRPYKCDFNNCKWSFPTKSKLERHRNSHLNLKWFECRNESCDKKFTTVYNLKQHLKLVHERAEEFACTVSSCGAAFHNQRSLDIHKATHTNLEPTYLCEHAGCEKVFVTRNALCSHMRSHERKAGDLKCSWEGCNKIYDKPCRLREHMRIHTGDKPYRCEHPGCGWSFYSGSKLIRHRNKHLQIRKHTCHINQCKKSFFRSQHLREHILTHSKDNTAKNLKCPDPDCESRFGSKNLVYKHYKQVHRLEAKSEISNTNVLGNESSIRITDSYTIPHSTLNSNCMNQLDSVTFLTGEFDGCASGSAPLTSQLPELMSSELLVDMTSIDSTNNGSLVDISAIDLPSNGESMVDISSIDPQSGETVIVNDPTARLTADSSSNNKSARKTRVSGSSGSARTNYTFDDVVREKAYRTELETNRRIKWNQNPEDETKSTKKSKNNSVPKQSEDIQNCKLSIPPDLVLGAPGMSDAHSLIVKDELYTQEDLQVLLLDHGALRHSIFEPSTINLRDLE